MGWLKEIIDKIKIGGTKDEFQSQPNATGPTPAHLLDPNRPRISDWGVGYPFYRGSSWSNYLSQGALVQSKDLSTSNILFNQNPSGTLAVSKKLGAEMYIPSFSGKVVSNTKIPSGYYKIGSTIKVVTAEEINGTVTEHTLKLMNFNDAKRKVDPSLKQFYDMHENMIDQSSKKASKLGNWWSNLIVGDLNPNVVASKIGMFVQVATVTAPLKKVSQQSAINAVRGQMTPLNPSLLPWEVGGAKGIRGITGSSPSRPITGGNQVPYKPSKTKEDTLLTTQNIALIGVGALAIYVYATRKK